MSAKLTLTLSKQVIDAAKEYASNEGKSLSEMVENYFKYLTENRVEESTKKISRRVSKLRGIMKVDDSFDYKAVLEEERSKRHAG